MSPFAIASTHSSSLTLNGDYSDHSSYNAYDVVAESLYLNNLIKERLKERFSELKEVWLSDTIFDSGLEQKTNHPAYIEIVSWGEIAIPLLIQDMIENGVDWFYALFEITGINPIKEENAGRFENIISDWEEWARENDFI